MNITIYFNSRKLLLSEGNTQISEYQEYKVIDERQFPLNNFEELVNAFINDSQNNGILLICKDVSQTFKRLKKHFYYIEAAGGFIENNQRYLFIHRHGRWDLPKGKLEKKETTELAAIRECEEECGIKNLKIVKPLSSTFHIYKYKDGYALKQSYWYYMTSNYNETLKPQTEESIDKVEWFHLNEIQSEILTDTYFTIADVVKEALGI